ncbi:MAG: hypothetical protein MR413_08030 [Clostridia bacterium]|nr:hypothetical protein [Clostridia bacterium]
MKDIETYRKELDDLILNCNYDMTSELIVKKSLEIEDKMYELQKAAYTSNYYTEK